MIRILLADVLSAVFQRNFRIVDLEDELLNDSTGALSFPCFDF